MRVKPSSQPIDKKYYWFGPFFPKLEPEECDPDPDPKPIPIPPPPTKRPRSGGKTLKRVKKEKDEPWAMDRSPGDGGWAAAMKRVKEEEEEPWAMDRSPRDGGWVAAMKRVKKEEDEPWAMDRSPRDGRRAAARRQRAKKESGERWSMDRYERAELKVMAVMRELAAPVGTRIVRKELREGARKFIGDTGLLDHLLKHMAGKVVGDGGERFMRGYNNDGVMEFWLEPTDLERSQGEDDGFMGQCGCGCRDEIERLMEKVSVLSRDLEDLRTLKKLEKSVRKENHETLLRKNIKLEEEMAGLRNSFQELEDNYERMVKSNIKLEAEIAGKDSSLQGLKEGILIGKEKKKEEKAAEVEMIGDYEGNSDNEVGHKKNENRQLHDHHLSKPPNTFCSAQLQRSYLQIPCQRQV